MTNQKRLMLGMMTLGCLFGLTKNSHAFCEGGTIVYSSAIPYCTYDIPVSSVTQPVISSAPVISSPTAPGNPYTEPSNPTNPGLVSAPAGSFDKHYNNGTVSCDTYCRGSEWGQVGVCIPVKAACDQVPGFLTTGAEWPCTCMPTTPIAPPVPSATFTKHGNNGTVSCNAYCSGSEWGQVGHCTSGQLSNVACGQMVGFIDNGQEITCMCSNHGKISPAHGNNGTVSCDTFCQWGSAACVSASLNQAPCDLTPGFLGGPELTCNCQ